MSAKRAEGKGERKLATETVNEDIDSFGLPAGANSERSNKNWRKGSEVIRTALHISTL